MAQRKHLTNERLMLFMFAMAVRYGPPENGKPITLPAKARCIRCAGWIPSGPAYQAQWPGRVTSPWYVHVGQCPEVVSDWLYDRDFVQVFDSHVMYSQLCGTCGVKRAEYRTIGYDDTGDIWLDYMCGLCVDKPSRSRV